MAMMTIISKTISPGFEVGGDALTRLWSKQMQAMMTEKAVAAVRIMTWLGGRVDAGGRQVHGWSRIWGCWGHETILREKAFRRAVVGGWKVVLRGDFWYLERRVARKI